MTRDSDELRRRNAGLLSDSMLIGLVQDRDEQAMADIFHQYSKLIFSIALRVLGDPTAAEDVMQEVFLRVWRDPGTFAETRGSLGGWLAVIARNRAIDLLRGRRPSESLEDLQLASSREGVDDAEHHILLEQVRVLVMNLPVEQRKALELAFFEGLTHVEIAQMMGHPLGTVKTRIRTALHSLGEALQS